MDELNGRAADAPASEECGRGAVRPKEERAPFHTSFCGRTQHRRGQACASQKRSARAAGRPQVVSLLGPPTHEVKVVCERVIPAVTEPGSAGSCREQLHDLRRPVDVVAVGAAIGERDIRLPEKEATAAEGRGRD